MPALLQLSNFSLSVGSSQLLDGVSAQVIDGQRVAVVGPNGCGKSTLLRALHRPDQNGYFLVGTGGINGQLSVNTRPVGSVLLVEQDELQWTRLFATADCDEEELRNMTLPEALDFVAAGTGDDGALEDVEAWRRLSLVAHDALGWAGYDTTPLGQLSPGCALRAYLAVALQRRDVELLLLDEPTNHLDLPSTLWLEQAIIASGKSVVVVSHDGVFLDAVATHLWSIDPEKHSISVSGASVSAFRRNRELAREQQRSAYEAQQERHKRLTAVADKLRVASVAGSAHISSDNDKLQRDFKRNRAGRSGRKAKAVEALRDSEPLIERVVDHAPLRIKLDAVQVGSRDSSIMLGSALLGYNREPLPLAPISLRVDFGERVAIVGANGIGKSCVLRTLSGEINPIQGHAHIGRELRLGQLTQEHESLPRHETPRHYMHKHTGMPPLEVGARLIRYGLTLQQLDRPIRELNPGARARVLLANFALRKVNALILDEPSNHLDDEAFGEVVATLNHFKGTVIVVSHNRHFLESLQLTRTMLLLPTGLTEIETIDEFMKITEDAVSNVVAYSGS